VGLLDDLSDDLHELPDRGLEIDVALGFGESLAEIGVLAEVELLEALHLRRIAIALMEQYGNQSSGWRERERVPLRSSVVRAEIARRKNRDHASGACQFFLEVGVGDAIERSVKGRE